MLIVLLFRSLRAVSVQIENVVDHDAELGAVLSRVFVLPCFVAQMAFHVDCGSFFHVFDTVVRLMSVYGQIDVDDVFPFFA